MHVPVRLRETCSFPSWDEQSRAYLRCKSFALILTSKWIPTALIQSLLNSIWGLMTERSAVMGVSAASFQSRAPRNKLSPLWKPRSIHRRASAAAIWGLPLQLHIGTSPMQSWKEDDYVLTVFLAVICYRMFLFNLEFREEEYVNGSGWQLNNNTWKALIDHSMIRESLSVEKLVKDMRK